MTSNQTIVIVGAGHGAGQAVVSLRAQGFDGRLTLIGEEPYVPYQRPPLSKKFLAGELDVDRIYFKPADFYSDKRVELMLGARVAELVPDQHYVKLHDGRRVRYDKLLLMTGSRVRTLDAPGVNLPGVFYLRGIDDAEGIREHFAPHAKLVVVGGGYIGLEVAAVAVKLGLDVTLVEGADRLMPRVVGNDVAHFFEDMHRQEGVKIETGKTVSGFEGRGKLERVLCSDGSHFDADIAVNGVGILPNQELAEAAGLDVDDGIVVDEFCQTQNANILAAGDCTNHPNSIFGTRVRLESVHNALEQAKTAASTLCGSPKAYVQVPWFWSDQYDVKMQIAGLSQCHDEVIIRGDPGARKFAAFYLRNGVVIAVDAINAAQEYMAARKLIAQKAKIAPDRLADTTIPMKEMV